MRLQTRGARRAVTHCDERTRVRTASQRQRIQSGDQFDPERPLRELFARSGRLSTAGFPARPGSRAAERGPLARRDRARDQRQRRRQVLRLDEPRRSSRRTARRPVELEEAYFETLALPKGFKIKAGKFLSDIGYLNPDPRARVGLRGCAARLRRDARRRLFGHRRAGALGRAHDAVLRGRRRALRGDTFPAANGADSNGTGAWTTFCARRRRRRHDEQLARGALVSRADANGRVSSFGVDPDVSTAVFTGSSELTIADFVWKWAKNGNPRDRYYVVQAEYLHRKESGALELALTGAGGLRRRLRRHAVRLLRAGRLSVQAALACRACGTTASTASNTVDFSGVPVFDPLADRSSAEPRERDGRFLEQRVQPLPSAIQPRRLARAVRRSDRPSIHDEPRRARRASVLRRRDMKTFAA